MKKTIENKQEEKTYLKVILFLICALFFSTGVWVAQHEANEEKQTYQEEISTLSQTVKDLSEALPTPTPVVHTVYITKIIYRDRIIPAATPVTPVEILPTPTVTPIPVYKPLAAEYSFSWEEKKASDTWKAFWGIGTVVGGGATSPAGAYGALTIQYKGDSQARVAVTNQGQVLIGADRTF